MAKISIVTSGLSGILNASFELVSRLENAGHDVMYMSPWNVEDIVKRQGYSYTQLPQINFDFIASTPEYKGPLRIPKRILHRHLHRQNGFQEGIFSLNFRNYVNILAQANLDLAIVDIELHEIVLAAKSINLPVIIFSQWFSNYNCKNLPPIVHDLMPYKRNTRSSFKISLARLFFDLRFRKQLVFQHLLGYVKRRDVLKFYAQKIGLSKNTLITSYFPPEFQYKNLPVWIMNQWELEFPHQPFNNVSYIGAMIYNKRKEVNIDDLLLSKLNEIIYSKNQKGDKLIYCSVSTFKKGDIGFIRNVLEAVSDIPGCVLIVSLAGNIAQDEFDSTPENCFLFSWVPQLHVLSNADCNINHGGIHTINECLHFSVPMLVYSGKRYDQNGCAARVQYHGIGIMGDKDIDGPQQIKEKLNTLINDNAYKARISEMNKKYKMQKENRILIKELDRMLNQYHTKANIT